ncbi:MAG: hypothetical protein IJY30_01625, partial [Muribaculaceae bacterium]|nr:hypothetical protein [Muribaculaceae bacterium]
RKYKRVNYSELPNNEVVYQSSDVWGLWREASDDVDIEFFENKNFVYIFTYGYKDGYEPHVANGVYEINGAELNFSGIWADQGTPFENSWEIVFLSSGKMVLDLAYEDDDEPPHYKALYRLD